MKKLFFIASLLMIISVKAQDMSPSFEKAGDMVKVTNFYEDGNIKEQGFYKNKVITGVWITYDKNGNKTAVANYKDGKKVGKWIVWTKNGIKEVEYKNNVVANVQSYEHNQMNIAIR